MITALTTILVLVSLGLVITVPVALATPGGRKLKDLLTVSKDGYSLFLLLQLLTVLQQHLNLLEIIVLTIISKLFAIDRCNKFFIDYIVE
jgi:PDZ domain-containing secreted protein